ncbi:MAG TPA: type II secretion system F family protein [Roseiflexaceae bacterium]|nr:type II secretion system F family protein [Roseiflexaceae bacterium]
MSLAIQAALLVGATVFVATLGLHQIYRSLQARDRLLVRAEDLGADPLTLSDPLRRQSFLARWADRYDRSAGAAAVRERLRLAYLPWKPSDYAVVRAAAGAALVYVGLVFFDLPPLPTVLVAIGAYVLVPKLFFASRRSAYTNALNAQLGEVTSLLANALRAGMSIQQALSQVVERMPEPAAGEFRQTHNELMLGDNLTQALTALRRRVGSRDLDVVVNAIVVQHQAGGNLARVLNAMSNILTERQRLSSEIDSLTAEARFSAVIVMIIPIALLLLLRGTPLGESLFTTIPGWIMLVMFLLVQVGIFLLIQKLARVEV